MIAKSVNGLQVFTSAIESALEFEMDLSQEDMVY